MSLAQTMLFKAGRLCEIPVTHSAMLFRFSAFLCCLSVPIQPWLLGETPSTFLTLVWRHRLLRHSTCRHSTDTHNHEAGIHLDLSASSHTSDVIFKAHQRANLIHHCIRAFSQDNLITISSVGWRVKFNVCSLSLLNQIGQLFRMDVGCWVKWFLCSVSRCLRHH